MGSLPDGALEEAENIYIDRPDTAEPRRGFRVYAEAFGDDESRAKQLLTYQRRILRHFDSTLSYDSATGDGPFTDYSDDIEEVQDGIKIKSVEINGNLYLTSSSGIKKLDQVDTELQKSGGIKALDLEADLSGATAGGFFSDDNQVAYRVVWGSKDRNNNLILGTPSERVVVVNDSGNSDTVDLTFTVPQGITVDHFYQIYRTRLSGASGVDPGDEQALVLEDNPTSGEISSKVVTLIDITPESFRGDELYTNANQQGILQANEIPPFAKDLTVYKNSIFYANTKTKHKLQLALLTTSNFTGSSTLTFSDDTNDFTLTFSDSSEDASIGQVMYETSGTPAQNVDDTARSIVRVINRYNANTFLYAFYVSGPDDVPGQILLETRDLGGDPFHVNSSDLTTGEGFNPTIPTSGSTVISDNEELQNRIYYSKFQQPEAVPILNTIDIGARNSPIIRVIALRDSLFVFKDDGIYRIIGDAQNGFSQSLFDNSSKITAPESPAVGNNQIYLLADQGVIRVTDTGVDIMSKYIQNQLKVLNSPSYTNFQSATFGMYYTTENRYYLWTVSATSDQYATNCFAFSVFTNAWTTLPISKTCGLVGRDDKIYLGAADINCIEQERKNYTYTDYADRQYNTIMSEYSDTVLVFNSVANLNIGDVVTQVEYLTPIKLDGLLAKLDEDPGIGFYNFYSDFRAADKTALRDALDALATQLDSLDLGHDTYLSSMSGDAEPEGIMDDFNILIGLLNTDTVVIDGDYRTTESTNTLETIVTAIDTLNKEVTVELAFDWDLATVTYYNRIVSKVTWAPLHAGDPSIFKHFRESNLMFSDISSNMVDLSYRSDIQRNFETVPFSSDSTGVWGVFPWGLEPWGGDTSPRAFRTYIPRQKQRSRFLEPKFEHKRAYENYLLVGLSITFDKMTERVGR